MKNNHSVTLTDQAWNEIQNIAKSKGHSVSQELEYLILHQKQFATANTDTFKTIFSELASLKKNIQDRFGASAKVEVKLYGLREKTVCIHRLLNIAGSLEKEKEYSVEEISARAGLDEGIIQSTIDSLGIFKKGANNKYSVPDEVL